ncbi:hypothetical protein H634G_02087 [Metarhizium anisopliae BRIP 53293]|uniref:Uncharacterized protein n=1 Tax=Metarhizium anisopliae BRIP 53293 TaxID=1291518 RepID=A0A0D9P8P1_METAN|nr:hypothetical protein H634G_02087 [Metarhizium anisopliae BRIP 53293]KJK89673.1 hypothetical protein H633G_06418 [Metarhizium anisopliae BRIP 53284]
MSSGKRVVAASLPDALKASEVVKPTAAIPNDATARVLSTAAELDVTILQTAISLQSFARVAVLFETALLIGESSIWGESESTKSSSCPHVRPFLESVILYHIWCLLRQLP